MIPSSGFSLLEVLIALAVVTSALLEDYECSPAFKTALGLLHIVNFYILSPLDYCKKTKQNKRKSMKKLKKRDSLLEAKAPLLNSEPHTKLDIKTTVYGQKSRPQNILFKIESEFVFFNYMPELFRDLEDLLKRENSLTKKYSHAHLETANTFDRPAARALINFFQYSGEKISDIEDIHIKLLIGCMLAETPNLFLYLLSKLDTASFFSQTIFEFYHVAVQCGRGIFFDHLRQCRLVPPPEIIAVAYQFGTKISIIEGLWRALPPTSLNYAMALLARSFYPGSTIQDLRLPRCIKEFYKEFNSSSAKIFLQDYKTDNESFELPLPFSAPQSNRLDVLNELAKEGSYSQIVQALKLADKPQASQPENKNLFYQMILDQKEIKGKDFKPIMDIMNVWVGAPMEAVEFFLENLGNAHQRLSFCLSLYGAPEDKPSLAALYLYNAIEDEQPFGLSDFRKLNCFLGRMGELNLEQVPIGGLDSSIMTLSDEKLFAQALNELGMLKNSPRKVADSKGQLQEDLSYPDQLIAIRNKISLPFSPEMGNRNGFLPDLPVVLQALIVEYLDEDELDKGKLANDIRISYSEINYSSGVVAQQVRLEKIILNINRLIEKLEKYSQNKCLIRVTNTKAYLFFLFLGLGGAINLIISSILLDREVRHRYAQEDAIVDSDLWQWCMALGYAIYGAGADESCWPPEITNPACDILCGQYNDLSYSSLFYRCLVWMLASVPIFLCFSGGASCRKEDWKPNVNEYLLPARFTEEFNKLFTHYPDDKPETNGRNVGSVPHLITDLKKLRDEKMRPRLANLKVLKASPVERSSGAGVQETKKPVSPSTPPWRLDMWGERERGEESDGERDIELALISKTANQPGA